MNKWQVSHTYTGSITLFQVYRLKDPRGIDHSGNREIFGTYDTDREAQQVADHLNWCAKYND